MIKEAVDIIEEGIGKVFTGAQLLVFEGDRILEYIVRGYTDVNGSKVNEHTLFDLASLTKPLCTTLVVIDLVKQGGFIDTTIASYLPEMSNRKIGAIVLKRLLNHSSGLAPWRPWGEEFIKKYGKDKAGLPWIKSLFWKRLFKEEIKHPPAYSDLGFLLISKFFEKLYKEKWAVICKDIYMAYVKDSPVFIKVVGGRPQTRLKNVVATRNTTYRGLIKGVVDDDNAFVLGGVAGHAGLFANAIQVHNILKMLINSYHRRGAIPQEIVREFWDYKNREGTSFVLGFDTPSPGYSQAGEDVPLGVVGHLGFTGTSFWLEPEKGIGSILLTNRVRLGSKEDIAKIRRAVHGMIWRKFG